MEYRAATWRTRRLAAEPCPLWSIGPFAINVLPLKAQVKDRVTRSPTPHHPLKFEITFCVRGVFSPILMNLFMHYAFDSWMVRNYPGVPFERFADDVVAHCVTKRQAEQVLAAIAERMGEVGLRLHPDKTRIVYCKDGKRRGEYEHTSFTFLGFTFRGRKARNKNGEYFN
ncbi:MAG TPA: reverse transcriptase domain-containing protein, partial [Terracidiphilus sp.]|nr:reverse transcriptase domain-containing protein [Terracidiphilus sp.]